MLLFAQSSIKCRTGLFAQLGDSGQIQNKGKYHVEYIVFIVSG